MIVADTVCEKRALFGPTEIMVWTLSFWAFALSQNELNQSCEQKSQLEFPLAFFPRSVFSHDVQTAKLIICAQCKSCTKRPGPP